MKMKREWFSRGVRMQHPFDELIDISGPMKTSSDSFEIERPMRVDRLSGTGKACYPNDYMLANDRPDPSPVCKPGGGRARMDSTRKDDAMELARPIPVGTKRRLGPIKTDK